MFIKKLARRAALSLAILMGGITILGVIMIYSYDQFGAIPKGAHLEMVKQSPQWHLERDIFVNRRPDILDTMDIGSRFLADPFGKDEPNFLFNDHQTVPEGRLPEERNPDLVAFSQSSDSVKFIWLGHSTILLSIDGKVVLIDPIFSSHAAPVKIAAERFQPPALSLYQLPAIDYIIISHDHYDHLDMETIKHFIGQDVRFLAPLGVGAHLRHWGVAEQNITELDWWDEAAFADLTFAATPSQHFSGRVGIVHNNKTLWASWVIKGQQERVFFSGDSGYDTHYQAIGDHYGPFDIVFMENGQYNEGWRAVHNMPDEAVRGFQELRGRYLVPVHWGMFDLSVHNWFDPPNAVTRLAKAQDIKLITPRLGQLIDMQDPPLFDQWWLEVTGTQKP